MMMGRMMMRRMRVSGPECEVRAPLPLRFVRSVFLFSLSVSCCFLQRSASLRDTHVASLLVHMMHGAFAFLIGVQILGQKPEHGLITNLHTYIHTHDGPSSKRAMQIYSQPACLPACITFGDETE